MTPELMHDDRKCLLCGACVTVCPVRCLAVRDGAWRIDRPACTLCGRCVEVCPSGALSMKGRVIEDGELLRILAEDRDFYDASGGGVTFSGGEPLLQAEALASLLPELRRAGMHVAVETAGFVAPDRLALLGDGVDLYLYDVKCMDPERHRLGTGEDNRLILRNLDFLARSGVPVVVRVPVIPGFNDTRDDVAAIAAHVAGLGLARMDLLPFHRLGGGKYRALGRPDPSASLVPPEAGLVRQLKETAESFGLQVRVEGQADTTANAGLPSQADTTANAGLPSQADTTANAGLPSQADTTANAGLPSQADTTANAGLPNGKPMA